MGRLVGLSSVYRWTMLLVVVAGLAIYAACDAPSSPERIEGPAVSGNRIPELSITTPAENIVLGQGANLTIRWSDQDRDSGAMISFALVNLNESASPATVLLVEGIPEDDDSADDAVTVSTAFVPRGAYHLRGTIGDGVNAPLSTFASTPAPASTRVVITIGEEGSTPGNRPPTIFVVEPMVNLSVTLDDTIEIVVQPTEDPFDVTTPFDADGTSRLFLSLDMDDDPNTGDPLSPDPDEIIPLLDEPEEIPEGTAGQLEPFQVSVDLSRFPAREDGKPYFIRVTITDDDNEPRDAYASGTISVTRPAAGLVDLDLVGGTLTGARWLGFDPGARLGAAMTSVGNFDFQVPTEDDPGDQVDDCMLVAQYGAPTGLGAIGEAYLVYGVAGQRFGGRINVNTVGKTVGGATFMGPVPRTGGSPETSGITSVGYVPDLTGDGRPELLFGCPFVDGVRTTRDDDTGDNSVPGSDEFVVEIRQGRITITNDRTDEVVSEFLTYDGVSDTYLDATLPTTPFGDEEHMFMDTGLLEEDVVPVRWALIKFEDLRSFVFDFALWNEDDYTLDTAVLEFESGLAGANSPTVNPLLHDFDPDFSTYDNWPFGGGDPVEDVDYDSDSADFEEDTTAGGGNKNTADVTTAFQEWLDGRLARPAFILHPAEEDLNNFVHFYTSDLGAFPDSRPILRVTYSVASEFVTNDGCYPDRLPNNTANSPLVQGGTDDVIAERGNRERLGLAVMINSENRDARGPSTIRRLDRATVSIDLAGMRPQTDSGLPHQTPTAGAVADTGRLEGARFQAGLFDVIDAFNLNQGPIRAEYGSRVDFLPDIGNDQRPEIIISAPRNELDIEELKAKYPELNESRIPHIRGRREHSNVTIFHGQNFGGITDGGGTSSLPFVSRVAPLANCSDDPIGRGLESARYSTLQIIGEKPSDQLGDASHAGDFNLDGSPDVLCGAQFADGPTGQDVGATYIVYQRQQNVQVEIDLANADFPSLRPPMLRIRGDLPNDRIGWAQEAVLDVNGDRIDDVVLASPYADAGRVVADVCSRDFNTNGLEADSEDSAAFSSCRTQFGEADLSSDNSCAFFDYNNDRKIDDLDAEVFGGGTCPVDNGLVAVVFGGITLDGDRRVAQIATSALPGVVFFGANAGDRAGFDVASAGDFNHDGFGDLLISVPGQTAMDDNGLPRVGVVYLIFGGSHLNNRSFTLTDVGSDDLPGIIFLSPYQAVSPNEAPPQFVAGLGDLNDDGFADIGIGNPLADFVDEQLPQEPGSAGSDLSTGRRRDAGEIYMIYGHNVTDSNP